MAGLETLGWVVLALLVPGAIFIGMGLAVWEYENGTPKWVEKLCDFLIKISDKFL